ncbi:hypothetical protein BC941DRAFT_418257 [Chlamydoabsidia padenii]|nr:hypothetical protein BC941DRAFT_418257 [Chlamydoabsidia padenii]
MVKSTSLLIAVAAIAGQQVMAQTPLPSVFPSVDPALLSSAFAQASQSLSALKNNPTYASIFSDPAFSSGLAQASSQIAGAAASGKAATGAKSSGSVAQPVGVAALAICAAVAVGML